MRHRKLRPRQSHSNCRCSTMDQWKLDDQPAPTNGSNGAPEVRRSSTLLHRRGIPRKRGDRFPRKKPTNRRAAVLETTDQQTELCFCTVPDRLVGCPSTCFPGGRIRSKCAVLTLIGRSAVSPRFDLTDDTKILVPGFETHDSTDLTPMIVSRFSDVRITNRYIGESSDKWE